MVTACRSAKSGKVKQVEGIAKVVDRSSNSKLRMRIGFASGAYWIFALDSDYRRALVGSPDGSGLWVLSRTPSISSEEYEGLLQIASEDGFDTSRLRRTPQPVGQASN